MRRIVLVAAVVTLVTACGGSSDSEGDNDPSAAPSSDAAGDTEGTTAAGSGDGPPDPCTLVTADEAADVLGEEPGEPSNVEAGGVRACTYRLSDGSAAVQINAERGDADVFMSELDGGNAEVVDGVGDGARVNATVGQVTVVQGDVRFAIFVMLPDGQGSDVATLTELAAAAVGRI